MKSRVLLGFLFSLTLVINMILAVNGLSTNPAKAFWDLGKWSDRSICESATIRIMPLGDSITHGSAIAGGYRIGLWNQFLEHNWHVDFVGSQANGPDIIDRNHEGHPGKTIQYLQANIEDWLGRYHPQIVLLMIGTNNVLHPEMHDFAHATTHLSILIQQIAETSPTTELLIASIPPLNNATADERGQQFNAAIPTLVSEYRDQGQQVHYVDIYHALTPMDLADGIHPNATGYAKMAMVWYNALFELTSQRCQAD
jgi:lysophospholipase L1-like esterase